ncbi:MAG: hypothetical protein R3C60_04995 [Parvularculaceae bacterium]
MLETLDLVLTLVFALLLFKTILRVERALDRVDIADPFARAL